jgi:hypothetical protein
MDSEYRATIPAHGVSLVKVTAQKTRLQEIFEAEYAWLNNFNLTVNSELVPDQARPVADAACSGKTKVVKIGKREDNYIEFRDVYASTAGKYTLTVYYLSEGAKGATLSVNGKSTLLTDLNSGRKGVVAKKSLTVELNKGYNTLRISNAYDWAPDIDKIEINLNNNKR